MPFVYTDLKAIENEPPVGNGDCVTLIKEKVPGLIGIPTSQWREGEKIVGSKNIARGTTIATFTNGRYPNQATGNHAAIFIAYGGGGFWVLDQWKNKKDGKITKRFMYPRKPRLDGTFDDASNSAQAFSVIELR